MGRLARGGGLIPLSGGLQAYPLLVMSSTIPAGHGVHLRTR